MGTPAARVGDPIAHSNAMAGLLMGAALGAVLAVAVVATGGLAAVAAGAVLAGGVAGGALAGEYIGAASMGPPTGAVAVGSPNVFINHRPAALAVLGLAACAKDGPAPLPIAMGAATVFVNDQPLARQNDKITCGAVILEGSPDVFVDDQTLQLLDVEPEVPAWLHNTLQVVALGAAVVGFGAAVAAVGAGVALAGLGGGLVGGMLGGRAGRAVGEALGLSEAQTRGLEVAGGMMGGMVGGAAATRAVQSLRTPPNTLGTNANGVATPRSDRVCTSGCPISMHTGEELLTLEDFVWDGPLPLVWRRFYRTAQSGIDLQLGHGWVTPLDEWVEQAEDGTLTYHDREGRRLRLPLPQPGSTGVNTAERIRVSHTPQGQLCLRPEDGPASLFTLGPGRRPLQALRSQDGHQIDLQYNAAGQVLALQSSWGKRLLVQRTGHRIAGIELDRSTYPGATAREAQLVRYAYSAEGDLTGALDRLDHGERYVYSRHLLVRRSLASGFSFQFEWDECSPRARCLRNWGDQGIYDYRFEWLPDGLSRAIDSRGGVTEYVHSDAGQLLRTTSPEGVSESFVYNEAGLLAQSSNPLGVFGRYSYNDEGLLLQQQDATGATYRLAYDAQGQLVQLRDPLGQAWRWAYDAQGRLQQTTDPLGGATHYRYNDQGLLCEVRNALGQTRTLWWDEHARPVAELGFDGLRRRFGHDSLDRVASVSTQDKRTHHYAWDALGQLIGLRGPDGALTQMAYNNLRQLTHWRDANGHTTEYRYDDGLRQPSARIDPMGQALHYHYDSERNLTGLTNARGDQYRLVWDKDERLVEQVGFDGRVQRYQYDAAGHLVGKVEALGTLPDGSTEWQLTQLRRDPLGRLLEKIRPDGQTSHYAYDPLGRLLQARTAHSSVSFAYDALGRVTREQQDNARLAHAHNALGQRVHTTLPDGQALHYTWNERGQLAQVSLDGQPVSQHQWDDLAQEVTRQQGDLQSRFDHDPAGRLRSQQARLRGKAQAVLGRQYQHDAAGRLATVADLRHGASHYLYDPADRLVGVEGATPERFVHDPAGNLLGSPGTNGQTAGQAQGNRLHMQADRHFAYDAAGNLVEERSGKAGHHVQRYDYDAEHRLVAAHTPGGSTHYRYDALGRRLAKTTAQGETRFYWDGATLLGEERLAGAANSARFDGVEAPLKRTASEHSPRLRWYLYEPESFRPLACVQREGSAAGPPQVYHYHLDHLGTPREMTDPSGRIVWSARYRAWGALALADVLEIDNPLRFQGQYHDLETGLHYNFQRYYDPALGRFIHQDPIGLSGGDNLYRYAPNPINWVDPWGLDPALVAQLGSDADAVGVYRFTDNQGRTYVGSTTDQNFSARLSQHVASGKLPATNIGSVQTLNMNGQGADAIYRTEASEIVRNGGRATDGGTTSNVRAPAGTRGMFHDEAWMANERNAASRFNNNGGC